MQRQRQQHAQAAAKGKDGSQFIKIKDSVDQSQFFEDWVYGASMIAHSE